MNSIITDIDRVAISTADFKDIILTHEDYCEYYVETGKLCPLIKEDINQNTDAMAWYPKNFNINICLYGCKYYKKADLPKLLQKKEAKK